MKVSLKEQLREFIEKADRPMELGHRVPIEPKPVPVAPIVAIERWIAADKCMTKTFRFGRLEDRDRFIIALLSYEHEKRHYATITMHKENVTVRLTTAGVDDVTALDREYAKYADVLFRDTAYNQ